MPEDMFIFVFCINKEWIASGVANQITAFVVVYISSNLQPATKML